MIKKFVFKYSLIIISLVMLQACVVNPVTGKRDFVIQGEEWEKKVGQEAYAPSIQSQGGPYLADPQVQSYVSNVLSKLAAVSDRPLPYEIVVLDNSVPNAWALPSGKMAINRGLLVELNSEAELAAVLGHEIVHAAALHGAKSQSRSVLLQAGLIAGAIATGGDQLAMQGANIGAQLINQKYGRGAELESDKYGMLYMSRAGYDPAAAVDLQETFVRLSDGQKTDFVTGLFASHPPSQERVEQNKLHVQSLPRGGVIGVEQYQNQIARLKNTSAAYEAYDEAKASLKSGDEAQARRLLSKARDIEPNEAKFDILEGDIYFYAQNYNKAIPFYNSAIQKNPRYFEGYFSRGVANFKSGNYSQSYPDLKKTDSLLPNFPNNYYYLGLLEEKQGNIQESIKYLGSIANAMPDSDLGKKSITELKRLSKSYPQYFR